MDLSEIMICLEIMKLTHLSYSLLDLKSARSSFGSPHLSNIYDLKIMRLSNNISEY